MLNDSDATDELVKRKILAMTDEEETEREMMGFGIMESSRGKRARQSQSPSNHPPPPAGDDHIPQTVQELVMNGYDLNLCMRAYELVGDKIAEILQVRHHTACHQRVLPCAAWFAVACFAASLLRCFAASCFAAAVMHVAHAFAAVCCPTACFAAAACTAAVYPPFSPHVYVCASPNSLPRRWWRCFRPQTLNPPSPLHHLVNSSPNL